VFHSFICSFVFFVVSQQKHAEASKKREARRMAREQAPKKRKTKNAVEDSASDTDDIDLSILKPDDSAINSNRKKRVKDKKVSKKAKKEKSEPVGWRGIFCDVMKSRVFENEFYGELREEFLHDVVRLDPRRRNETLESITQELLSDTELHEFPPRGAERKILRSFQKRAQAFFKYFTEKYPLGEELHDHAAYLAGQWYQGFHFGLEKAERRAFREANPQAPQRSPEPRDFGAPINSGSRRRPQE
jgi:hypothetical protein